MGGLLSEGLIVPALFLGLVGFAIPRVLARLLPEGVTPLMINGFVSTVVTFVLASGLFYLLYLWQGAPLDRLGGAGPDALVFHFGSLGLASALIWAPVMILSLAGLPRRWVHETW